ncbi:hypothetical protein RCC89_11715 [Cytophagaceae bacterium ABcell3]|nr:hypothetical protein RCC89_11715 [Cytophagaceae bacterium ABcell3]
MKSCFLISIVIALCFLGSSAFGQRQDTTQVKRASVSLEGMIGFSVGNDFYSLNVGGPSLFLNLNKDWKIGVGALPSLYLLEGQLGARLAVSPRVDYKNFVFIVPFFHRDLTNEWIWSVGFGYKFHKK